MEMTVEQALEQAVAAHREGNLQDAERLYRAILQSQPAHPDANHNLGVLAVSVNEIEAALSLFKTALEANPKIEQFWLSYIDAFIKAKQFESAKQAVEQAKNQGTATERLQVLETQIESANVAENADGLSPPREQLNALLEHYQAARVDDAEKLAKLMTQTYPSHPFSWKVLGVILKSTGRITESLVAMKKTVQLAARDAEAHNNLGNTLKQLGTLDEAEVSYTQAIALQPDFAEAHNNLGITLQELGRLDEAVANYNQAIALKPDFADAHANLGITLQTLGRLDEAVASYNRAIVLQPDYFSAHSNLGTTLQELGRLDEAVASCNEAIALKPDFADAHNNLGSALEDLGRLDEATASYKQAIALEPTKFVEAYNSLGAILQKLGELDEAEVCFKKWSSLKPETMPRIVSRGSSFFYQGFFEQALAAFESYEDPASKAQVFESLWALGRVDEIYSRLEAEAGLHDDNLRVAAIAAFLAEREKKDTAHNFCNNPMEFLYFANISSKMEACACSTEVVINELRHAKSKWEHNTTVNGFHGDGDIFENPLPKMSRLKEIILGEISTYYSKFKDGACSYIKNWPTEKNIKGWHVILSKQGYHTPHIHPSGWLSGVVYLKVVPALGRNEGAIEFSLNGSNYHHKNAPSMIFQPKAGDIVMFPSSLHHRTIPFSTDADRIMVAFDLQPENKKLTPEKK